MKFSEQDIQQIKNKGITPEQVEQQINQFKNGVPYVNLISAAQINDGIIKLNPEAEQVYIKLFESKINDIKSIKFVPASGAATRMFKFLFEFLTEYHPEKESINAYINKSKARDLQVFRVGLEKFPFYDSILKQIKTLGIDVAQLSVSELLYHFVSVMLNESQLDFGNYPKGLIPFHKYNNDVSTAFEEHLFETALYASKLKPAELHFTISEKFKNKFKAEFERIEKRAEQKTGVSFEISFSYQHKSTDTIAVKPNNEPFRDKNGLLLFRPSGHGALLKNLNAINADLIFIKNIDNVVVKQYKNEVAKYKKILGGLLLKIQKKVFGYLRLLHTEVSQVELNEISEFLSSELNVKISEEVKKYTFAYQIEYFKEKLNRPIRVCGMVKNEGEPGGGPFWVKDKNGNISLQIVESAQINKKLKKQKKILNGATHFNPVDLVCGVKNYQGQKFDLSQYVDHQAIFISKKNKNGKELKALELPGLWNGSMANWNTVFVEVPINTFNPVKTVNDLLKSRHQIKNNVKH